MRRFGVLRVVAVLLKGFACSSAILSLILFVVAQYVAADTLLQLAPVSNGINQSIILATWCIPSLPLLGALLGALFTYAFAQFIDLMLAIEENTRHSADIAIVQAVPKSAPRNLWAEHA